MPRIFLFILVLFVATRSAAQVEFSPKFKPIAPIKNKPNKENTATLPTSPKLDLPQIKTPNIFKETNIFGTKPKPNNSFQMGIPENLFSMTPKKIFTHQLGDVYLSKMTKDLDKTLVREGLKEDDRLLVKIDIKFGEIRTKSDYFIVKYRDFGDIDGDLFRVFFNEDVFADKIFLEYDLNEFKIFLKVGINTMSIQALNKGAIGGNTGEFQIYDSKGKHILTDYWQNLDAGVRANFIIIRE
jgi:hypothetical protein